MKKGFWTSDWFTGLIFSAIFFGTAYLFASDAFHGVETAAYDIGMRASTAEPSDQISVIAIDDESINNIGRWPWPRNVHAELIDRLNEAGAKVVGSTVFFSEEAKIRGLDYINALAAHYDSSSIGRFAPGPGGQAESEAPGTAAAGEAPEGDEPESADAAAASESTGRETASEPTGEKAAEGDAGSPQEAGDETENGSGEPGEATGEEEPEVPRVPPVLVNDLTVMRSLLMQARNELQPFTDERLAKSIEQADNVVIPMTFKLGAPLGRLEEDPPGWLLDNALYQVQEGARGAIAPIQAREMRTDPIPIIGRAASRVGHLNATLDADGAQRTEALVLQYYDIFVPSLALQIAAESLNLQPDDIIVRLGEQVQLANLEIRTTPRLRMYNYFYSTKGDKPAFPVDSFSDIYFDKIPASKYEDKIVLIGATAAGIGDSLPTPVSANMSPVMSLAHAVSSILQEDFFVRPEWASLAELGAFLFLALYITFLLPRLKPGIGAIVSFVLAAGLISTEYTLMATHSMWLQLTVPTLFLVAGHLLMTIKLFRVTEKIRIHSEAEGAESNKMLGLAFQGQGQLDMAFDKFRKCPLDDKMMDVLYNLALDFERKRQFNKAANVYQYMADHDPNYRDLQEKLKRSKKMEETVMLGGGGGTAGGGTMVMGEDGEVEKPMLGRYQVEKELGKGAMGIVYMGRDPKINREVAIKTMALAQEFEEDEIDEVKERFFREAETAGRLNHPAIVTIYDAGEEHDLAYIAMEFLHGADLTQHTKSDNLLPAKTVMDIIATSAEALDYAHKQGVVHRDIKPANLMFENESSGIKITDFGIARITDSSKTKTGMVLGTPSYMSPEQLAGKKVDGRSDLFSLGVTLYQMLTGRLPFQADSMATLMYKIANEPHDPPSAATQGLPECVDGIINKALEKDVEKRYQHGNDMAKDIRDCAAKLD